MTFGERLKELRNEAGLTHEQLGDKIGYKKRMVQFLESGQREPNLEALRKLSRSLGCTTEYLLGFSENKISKRAQQLMEEYEYYLESYKTMQSALQKIANGCDNPQEVAKEALKEVTGED